MTNIKKSTSDQVFQLKITLNDIKPPIWRRILVNSDITLPDLHKIIQTAMGWTNSHLHQFIINNTYYSMPDEDDELFFEVIDYRNIKLNSLVNLPKSKFFYEYDFGDCWEHTIVIEKILPRDGNMYYPVCIDGKRNCPPEDCGGPGGYEELVEILKDPTHKDYKETIEWLSGDFDPEYFNINEVNKLLHRKNYGCIDFFE